MPRLVFASSVSSEWRGRLAQDLKFALNDAGDIFVSDAFDESDIARCLVPPLRGGIQLPVELAELGSRYFRTHLQAGGVGLSLTTGLAYESDVVGPFIQALWRAAGSKPADDVICLAVHEAFANALVHGNLEVPRLDEDLDAFMGHCHLLDEARNDPQRWNRRIELSGLCQGDVIEIAIQDQGRGYQPKSEVLAAGQRLHGLELIEACAQGVRIEDGGRCLVLVFPVNKDEVA